MKTEKQFNKHFNLRTFQFCKVSDLTLIKQLRASEFYAREYKPVTTIKSFWIINN